MTSICLVPYIEGLGGPASFQQRLKKELEIRGITLHHDPDKPGTDAILVNGGTRRLDKLIRARRRGIKIVQRLNGMNWVHKKANTGLRHYIKAEMNNRLLAWVRMYFADAIIYQSQFSLNWWNEVFRPVNTDCVVVYNGVDMDEYNPEGAHDRPTEGLRILLVEGRLGNGYEVGLENAVRLVYRLKTLRTDRVELWIAGQVTENIRSAYAMYDWINWLGVVPRAEIPKLDRTAHFLFSGDLNAACPNSVIEALACGLPVVGYDTGALSELLGQMGGAVLSYGTDFTRLLPADSGELALTLLKMKVDWERYHLGARMRAEEAFDVKKMTDKYMQIMLG